MVGCEVMRDLTNDKASFFSPITHDQSYYWPITEVWVSTYCKGAKNEIAWYSWLTVLDRSCFLNPAKTLKFNRSREECVMSWTNGESEARRWKSLTLNELTLNCIQISHQFPFGSIYREVILKGACQCFFHPFCTPRTNAVKKLSWPRNEIVA